MVVTVETHPQAKGCLQDNKLSTQVDLNSTDGGDRWDDHRSIDLKNTDMFILMMQQELGIHLKQSPWALCLFNAPNESDLVFWSQYFDLLSHKNTNKEY